MTPGRPRPRLKSSTIPLAAGASILIYEGAPNAPHEGRFWEIIEQEKPTIFYTAPTAIRSFMKWGMQHIDGRDLSSLRLLGTVGEGINPEAWIWYHEVIGGKHRGDRVWPVLQGDFGRHRHGCR